MKTEQLKNKEGKVLKTKDTNQPLVKNVLEKGDEFIPLTNSVIEKTKTALVLDEKTGQEEMKKITNYSILAKVEDSEGNEKEIFIELTPTQAKSIQKKLKEGIEINQHIFTTYEYSREGESKKYLGVGIKKTFKEAKSFKDFYEQE